MEPIAIVTKDPDAVLDYSIDWTPWLTEKSDTVATTVWDVPTGLTVLHLGPTGAITTVWLTGGTLYQTYAITSRITTTGGRTDDRTIKIRIAQR